MNSRLVLTIISIIPCSHWLIAKKHDQKIVSKLNNSFFPFLNKASKLIGNRFPITAPGAGTVAKWSRALFETIPSGRSRVLILAKAAMGMTN